jgi:hypothetical protein
MSSQGAFPESLINDTLSLVLSKSGFVMLVFMNTVFLLKNECKYGNSFIFLATDLYLTYFPT